MRPERLELQGFSAFREPTILDFSDLDLFALVGPTGAGKSTVIDGIVFALYGSVVRYRASNLVAPVINQLSTEARVRLDFRVNGDLYTAARVVRRTATGATTKEARLERGEEVLAGNARELDAAVEGLLGLDFDQFTKTVVLPQGEFARFLNETTEARQALLRRLLGMELYRDVGTAARERSRAAAATVAALEEQIISDDLHDGSIVDAARDRLQSLTAIHDDVNASLADLESASGEAQRLSAEVDRLSNLLKVLKAAKTPAGTNRLVQRMERLETDQQAALAKAEAARDALSVATEAVESSRSIETLETLIGQHDELKKLRAAHKVAVKAVATNKLAVREAEKRSEKSHARRVEAEKELDEARVRAGAAGIAQNLAVGDSCPVCEQVVHALPKHDHGDDLADHETALQRAREEEDEASTALAAAGRGFDHAEIEAENGAAQVEGAERDIAGDPDRKTLTAELKESRRARSILDKAAAAAAAAQARLADLGDRRADLENETATLRRTLTNNRDQVAELDPPPPGEESIVADWQDYTTWAEATAATITEQKREASAEQRRVARDAKSHQSTLKKLFAPFANQTPDDPRSWLAREQGRAQAAVDELERQQLQLQKNAERLETLRAESAVARELGKLLNAKGFEQWLMSDVMGDLAEAASVRLLELSGGAYSLVTDGSDFSIRDHRNADEVRSARTLSGGETFLASLSLALALSQSVAELAAEGAPRIESMFLDEGFGTLDEETLDTVASAIEELGAVGHMIGVVTHVSDLADRIPSQFRVTKTATGSAVERLEG